MLRTGKDGGGKQHAGNHHSPNSIYDYDFVHLFTPTNKLLAINDVLWDLFLVNISRFTRDVRGEMSAIGESRGSSLRAGLNRRP